MCIHTDGAVNIEESEIIQKSGELVDDEAYKAISSVINRDQLMIGLFGEGGTGKSYLITAVMEFAHRWGVKKSIILSATTGDAVLWE